MVIDVERGPDTTVVVVRGDVDVSCAYELYLAAVTHDEGVRVPVLLDLAGVSFLDSVGLSMLIRSRDELAADGVPLLLRRPSRQVTDLLALTALDGQFRVVA